MSATLSTIYAEEGELWLRSAPVSAGHAISEQWLRE